MRKDDSETVRYDCRAVVSFPEPSASRQTVLMSGMRAPISDFYVALCCALIAVGAAGCSQAESQTSSKGDNQGAVAAPFTNAMGTFQKPSETELKQKLNRMQFDVTQHAATEPAFRNEYWNNHKPGIYVDIVSGQP